MHIAKTSSRAAGLLGGACIAVLALAGCGGSSHAANASTTTTTPGRFGRNGAALNAFRDCMSSHGVTLPQRPRNGNRPPGSTTPGDSRPRGGFGFGGGGFSDQPPPGVDATKYQNAINACRSTLPNGGNFDNSAFQAYRSCLQDHGVTLPAQGGAGSINRNDPKVQSAMKTCAPLLPQGFGRGGSTTTAPTS